MARALHIILTLDPANGGPAEGTIQLGEAWNGLGYTQDLLTFDAPDSPHLARYPGKVHALGVEASGRFAQFFPDRDAVRRIAEIAGGYDAVIVSSLWDPIVVAASRALPGLGKRTFVYPHGSLNPWFRKHYPVKHLFKQVSWMMNQGPLLNSATAVLFTTADEMNEAGGQFFPYRVEGRVVGYGTRDPGGDPEVQREAFYSQFPQFRDKPFIMFLSRVHEKKGIDLLIEGFARVADRYAGDLVIAGPGEPELIEALKGVALRCGLAERVHFVGMVLGDAKWGAFRACDAFALTSHSENFGVAVAEAMACEAPVLISDCVNIWPEVAADGAGLVGKDTVEGAVDVLERFIALPPEERRAMGQRGRQSFFAHFEVGHTAEKLARLVFGDLI